MVSDTGNVLYFMSATSGPASAGIIGGGNNVGDDYFSDNFGAPSPDFSLGNLNGPACVLMAIFTTTL